MVMGRPTKYTPELVELILERISTCTVGLRKLCKMHADMPDIDTIYEWRNKYEDFSERYLNSRSKQAHYLAEQTKDIAEETLDYVFKDERGVSKIDSGIVAMQKFRMTTNTWLASRINPKEYGERIISEQSNDQSIQSTAEATSKIKEAEKEY